ncbi:MAG: hypothetical protein ACREKL_01705 [Chthoniobacterales bacterium]
MAPVPPGIRWFPDVHLAYAFCMATKKKKSPAKKSTVSKAKARVSKALPKKVSKSLPKKAKPAKVSTSATKIPQGREHKLAEQALTLVDQAAAVLRSGIRGGAKTTAQSRIAAKKKANELLGKASSNLNSAISSGTSALQNLLGKI